MLNSVEVWYLLCWSAELITQCNGCLVDFTPRQTLGSMKTTCFSLFAQLWLCNIGKYYWHIWTRWILNKALPTFLLFLITWELCPYHFLFTQTEDCSEYMQPSTINCSYIIVHIAIYIQVWYIYLMVTWCRWHRCDKLAIYIYTLQSNGSV